jgi:hypothetical protein
MATRGEGSRTLGAQRMSPAERMARTKELSAAVMRATASRSDRLREIGGTPSRPVGKETAASDQ